MQPGIRKKEREKERGGFNPKLKWVKHPANSDSLHNSYNRNINFEIFYSHVWGFGCKDIQQIRKDIPPSKFLKP